MSYPPRTANPVLLTDRMTALEVRVLGTLDDLHRELATIRLSLATILDALGLPAPTPAQVDAALAAATLRR